MPSELPVEVVTAIVSVIGFLVMLFGPKPLGKILDKLRIPKGWPREVAVYVAAVVVAAIALAIAGAISGVPSGPEGWLALGGLFALTVAASFQRLKDAGSL